MYPVLEVYKLLIRVLIDHFSENRGLSFATRFVAVRNLAISCIVLCVQYMSYYSVRLEYFTSTAA